jgi:predicted ArsR family transcriptional regulator
MADDVLKKHHHSDIWKGFRNLENRGLIKESKLTQEERVKAKGRGNPRKYYQITEDGTLCSYPCSRNSRKVLAGNDNILPP